MHPGYRGSPVIPSQTRVHSCWLLFQKLLKAWTCSSSLKWAQISVPKDLHRINACKHSSRVCSRLDWRPAVAAFNSNLLRQHASALMAPPKWRVCCSRNYSFILQLRLAEVRHTHSHPLLCQILVVCNPTITMALFLRQQESTPPAHPPTQSETTNTPTKLFHLFDSFIWVNRDSLVLSSEKTWGTHQANCRLMELRSIRLQGPTRGQLVRQVTLNTWTVLINQWRTK